MKIRLFFALALILFVGELAARCTLFTVYDEGGNIVYQSRTCYPENEPRVTIGWDSGGMPTTDEGWFNDLEQELGLGSGFQFPPNDFDVDGDGKMDCLWKGFEDPSVSSPYGPRNITGGSRDHQGIDVTSSAPNYGKGSAVRALNRGYATTGTDIYNGNYIRITHPDGRESFYGHLQSFTIPNMTQVEVGQQIATMNCTGRCIDRMGQSNTAMGTHVHLAVYKEAGQRDVNSFEDNLDPQDYYNTDCE